MQKIKHSTKSGDTLIEVLFALSVFSFLSIITINLMNNTTAIAQGNLEATMARSLLDEQAETIRFAHDAYVNSVYEDKGLLGSIHSIWTLEDLIGKNEMPKYVALWKDIIENTIDKDEVVKLSEISSCSDIKIPEGAFAINSRDPSSGLIYDIQQASLYPRIIYENNSGAEDKTDDAMVLLERSSSTKAVRTEGFWAYAIDGESYYDFYLQACWYAPGHSAPTTLDTIIRLYQI